MWIASKFGFYSIVCKDTDEFHVRARLRVDLENLLAAINVDEEIHQSEYADYRYRLVVSSEVVRKITTTFAATLDYPNFKNGLQKAHRRNPNLMRIIRSGKSCMRNRNEYYPEKNICVFELIISTTTTMTRVKASSYAPYDPNQPREGF